MAIVEIPRRDVRPGELFWHKGGEQYPYTAIAGSSNAPLPLPAVNTDFQLVYSGRDIVVCVDRELPDERTGPRNRRRRWYGRRTGNHGRQARGRPADLG